MCSSVKNSAPWILVAISCSTLESYHYGIVITETLFSVYFIFFFFFLFFLALSEFKLVKKKFFLLHCIPDRWHPLVQLFWLFTKCTNYIFVLFHLMLLLCCTLLSCLLFFFLYPLISGPLSCKSYNHHPFIFLPLQTILHPTTSIQILMTHYLHIAAFKFHLTLRTSSYTHNCCNSYWHVCHYKYVARFPLSCQENL